MTDPNVIISSQKHIMSICQGVQKVCLPCNIMYLHYTFYIKTMSLKDLHQYKH